jgi:hypothetical protein
MKTVLAPNAPWPKWEEPPKPEIKTVKRNPRPPAPKLNLSGDLDYFAEAREQLNKSKTAIKSRARSVTTGRFKGNNRLSG